MSNNENDYKGKTHEYDGIIEHDHPLPRWWVFIFYATIVFSIFYYGYYELLGGPTLDQELEVKMAKIKEMQQQTAGEAEGLLVAKAGDADFLNIGSKVYTERCFMCHGDQGQGLIGPSFLDNYWIHGKGTPEDVLHIVKVGVPEKGMVPWEGVLSPEEQAAVSLYVLTFVGKNHPSAKPPEGVEVKD